MDYTSLHWGSEPTRTITTQVPAAGAVIGKVAAISYVTRKDEPTVYEHKFEKMPPLCRALSQRHRADRHRLFQIGMIVDLKLEDGRVLVGGGCSVSTDETGRFLVITSPHCPQFQFGAWGDEIAVTDHGIVL